MVGSFVFSLSAAKIRKKLCESIIETMLECSDDFFFFWWGGFDVIVYSLSYLEAYHERLRLQINLHVKFSFSCVGLSDHVE